MSHTMIHLKVAMNIVNSIDKITNKADFILGSMSPDAVHFRESYESTMKRNSHLCLGEERWGSITNNDEWSCNILRYMSECKDKSNRDFLLGYYCHILTDVQNNKNVWMPYREKAFKDTAFDGGKKYSQESFNLDYALYLEEDTKDIMNLLAEGEAYSIADIITKDEIELMRLDTIEKRYIDRENIDISNHEYVTMDSMKKFIKNESEYIKNLILQVL